MAHPLPSAQAQSLEAHRRVIGLWLAIVALMVFAMVIVGGATRLTDSGLSIVEWKPVTGAIPPLNEAQWQVEFEKYQQIPEYQVINRGMSLGDFKFIYWWEWSHRQLGRTIGLVFALPLAFFWIRGWLEPGLKPRLLGLLALGGSQGALGWWMVASGLTQRTDVSQFRLAAHLTLASLILVAILWVMRSIAPVRTADRRSGWQALLATILLALVIGQLFLGGLVAGLDAGLSHTTWPLMDGYFIPPTESLYAMTPGWVNHFDNVLTVQFQHRMVAYLIVVVAIWQMVDLGRVNGPAARRATVLAAMTLCQAGLGVMTLLLEVPLWAGLLHQAFAIMLLAMATVHGHAMWRDLRAVQTLSPAVPAASVA